MDVENELDLLANADPEIRAFASKLNESSATEVDQAKWSIESSAEEESAPPAPSGWLARLKNLVVGKGNERLMGLLMLNFMALLMGSNWVVVKQMDAIIDPFLFAALRFGIASAALIPFIQEPWEEGVPFAGVELGVWSGLGYLAQSQALVTTDASRASLLSTFTVLLVPVLAGLAGERVRPLVWPCALAALAGTSLLEQSGIAPNVGDAVGVLSALFFAFQLFRTEHYTRVLPRSAMLPIICISTATISGMSMLAAGAEHTADITAALTGHSLADVPGMVGQAVNSLTKGHGSELPWGSLVYTSLCSTDLVLILEMMALSFVSSTEAALIYTLEPVSGALMAWAILGERWGPIGWVGAAIIIGSTLVVQLTGAEEKKSLDIPSSS